MKSMLLLMATVSMGCALGGSDLVEPEAKVTTADVVGAPCTPAEGCPFVKPIAYCAREGGPSGAPPYALGVCTATCQTHEECGCVVGTTNESIAAGGCKASCVTPSPGAVGYCVKVCASTSGCAPTAECKDLGGGYGGCVAP